MSFDLFRRAALLLRMTLFPTEQDRELERWKADNPNEDLRYSYDLESESLVIDLGGYKGQWASDIYARYNCNVIVFEPVKSFAEGIRERFKRNSRIRVFCLALGESRKQVAIALSADGSSVYRKGAQTELIDYEDASEFFRSHQLTTVDLMKINIEGGEYELLPRLIDTGLIQRIDRMQVQFHDIDTGSEKRMRDIWGKLEKTHELRYRYKFIWEEWTRRSPR